MRVVMISKACVVGIYQRKLEEMAAAWPEMELTVVVPPHWQGRKLERLHTNGYRLAVLPQMFAGRFHWHFYPTLGKLLREVRPALVHLDEEPYNLATFHANRLARLYGAKTLWFSWQNLLRHYPLPFSLWEKYTLHHSDYALVGSHSAAQVWRAKGYRGPLQVLPQFGVDPEFFTPPASPRPTSPVHLAYVGRLVPEKGVDVLLQALADLPGRWRVTILGDGPEEMALRRLALKLRIAGRVMFRPAIASKEMPRFYHTVDVLVLPSRTRRNWMEQFGRVLIEAMACNVAVVGAESGEIPHVIGDAGLTFPEGDVDALRKNLHELIGDAARRQSLGRAGRVRVLTHFTQRHIADETVGVYREVLG